MEFDPETELTDFVNEEEKILEDHNQYKKNRKVRAQKPSGGSFFRKRYILLIAVAVFIILLIMYARSGKSRYDEQISSVATDMANVKNSLSDLDAKIKGLQGSLSELENSNASSAQHMDALENRLTEIENKYTSLSTNTQNSSKSAEKSAGSKGKKTYYEVKRGDTLYSIAKKYGISTEKLQSLNGIGKNQDISPGQKLVVK